MKRLSIVGMFILALARPAVAQTAGGSITGSVRDEQSATVPGADVTARGSDATFRFTTNADGAFRFLDLPPGAYELAASRSGFRTATRQVIVGVGKTVDAPLELRVADFKDLVTVSAPAPILDATATGTSTTFSRDELARIPTSRDPFAVLRAA